MIKKIILLALVLFASISFASPLTKKYALVFIYESTCPYCQRMAPVVHEIQKEYAMQLYAISADHKRLDTLGGKAINLPLSAEITHQYYGSTPVRFPLLVLQQLNGPMNHYVIANGYTPKQEVQIVLNSYLNHLNQVNY